MDCEFTVSSALSEKYATDVLRYLYGKESEVKYRDLKFIVNNFPTLEKLITTLESANLVSTRKVLKPYKTNLVELTGLGKLVAKRLQDAENLINGIAVEDDQTDYETSSAKGNNLA